MSTATKKAAIAAVISGSSRTDKVWTRERNPETDQKFRDAFTSTDARGPTLHGWTVHWLRRETEQLGCGEEDDYDTFRVRGYYAWKDDGERDSNNSSDAWDAIVEGVLTEFAGEQTLGGEVDHMDPASLTQNTYVEAFGTFCHFAEMELTTRTRRSGITYS